MDVTVWLVCGVTAIVAGALAGRSRRAMIVGRIAVGVLMLVGGAVVNATYLWFAHRDYAPFADPAHFGWVTDTWHSVVAPHQAVFINLLIVFEAVVGILILSGGRRTQVGLVAAIGFHAALWLFGWIETVYVLVMLPPLVLLLLAERRRAPRASAARLSSAAS
ncbi:MAG TPA: hypothetical protein VGN47_02210 [Blastococcus sp.]|jgi:hypothetical protein|nr:hypothetical protein [Blastococcus sp.]